MRRSGMRGINAILITGRILIKSIPIGADIASASVMTRIFIINTITARGEVGIKDSRASVLLEPEAVSEVGRGNAQAGAFVVIAVSVQCGCETFVELMAHSGLALQVGRGKRIEATVAEIDIQETVEFGPMFDGDAFAGGEHLGLLAGIFRPAVTGARGGADLPAAAEGFGI